MARLNPAIKGGHPLERLKVIIILV